MDRSRDDGAFRDVGGVAGENERAELLLSTYLRFNI